MEVGGQTHTPAPLTEGIEPLVRQEAWCASERIWISFHYLLVLLKFLLKKYAMPLTQHPKRELVHWEWPNVWANHWRDRTGGRKTSLHTFIRNLDLEYLFMSKCEDRDLGLRHWFPNDAATERNMCVRVCVCVWGGCIYVYVYVHIYIYRHWSWVFVITCSFA